MSIDKGHTTGRSNRENFFRVLENVISNEHLWTEAYTLGWQALVMWLWMTTIYIGLST
jgi:hypothetical protein